MAIPHAAPGEVIAIRAGRTVAAPDDSETLVRTDHFEVFRYALAAGKTYPDRTAAGLMLVQCMEGVVEIEALGKSSRLAPGSMLYLPDGEPHTLRALTDSLLLVTLLLNRA
jgi:quercetin dioxygenase-like cupin family protein